MTNLYDLEELNPLITNMPPEVQVQYFQRFGPGLIRPFKRSVLDQLTRRPLPRPLPQVSEQLTAQPGLRLITAQQRAVHPTITAQQVAAVAYQVTKQRLHQQDLALQAQAQDGKDKAQAAAQHFFAQSLRSVGALLLSGLMILGLSLGLITSSDDTEHLNAIATEVSHLATNHSSDTVSLGSNPVVPLSLLADDATQANLTSMVLKGPELLSHEAALQDVGGNCVQTSPQGDPELAEYERILLEHGVVPSDAHSAAIARYYLPEHLSHVDYYVRARTYQPPRTLLQPDYTQLNALQLRDQAGSSAPAQHLAPLFFDPATPLTDLSGREG